MSLITSCPACGTMFRVVPDQLKISEGWVRCGHCSEVFDASAHLSDESVLGNLAEAQGTMSMGLDALQDTPAFDPPPEPTFPAPLPTRPAELYEQKPPPARAPRAAPPQPPPPGPQDFSDRSAEPSDFFEEEEEEETPHKLEPSPLDAPFVFRRSEISMADLTPPAPGEESQMLPEDFERAAVPEKLPDVSFVRQARRKAFWRRPFVRLLMFLLFLGLAGLLAVQVGYQDRDRLALLQPELRPALERMCELLECSLDAPRQIESIVIDSSGFSRVRNDTYRLSFTLRNSAPVPLAVPSMELTLTDAQDQPVARRVLSPAELDAAQARLPAAGEWSRAVGVTVDAGSGTRVAGYRLLAFYP